MFSRLLYWPQTLQFKDTCGVYPRWSLTTWMSDTFCFPLISLILYWGAVVSLLWNEYDGKIYWNSMWIYKTLEPVVTKLKLTLKCLFRAKNSTLQFVTISRGCHVWSVPQSLHLDLDWIRCCVRRHYIARASRFTYYWATISANDLAGNSADWILLMMSGRKMFQSLTVWEKAEFQYIGLG